MQINKRTSWLHWIIVLASLGQYAFLWAYLLFRDVSRLNGQPKEKTAKHGRNMAILYAIYICGFLTLQIGFMSEGSFQGTMKATYLFPLELAIGLTLFVYFLFLISRTSTMLQLVSNEEVPSSLVMTLCTFVYVISLPILQGKLNKTIKHIKASEVTVYDRTSS